MRVSGFDNDKSEILKSLEKVAQKFICPACGKEEFALAGGYSEIALMNDIHGSHSGKSIPTVPVLCTNCGFIAQFAVGALGFSLNQKEKPNGKKTPDK